MFRNLFAAMTTLLVGATGASASTPATTPADLDSRIQSAQKAISLLPDLTDPQPIVRDGEKVAQYWGNGYYRPRWSNWNNWRNYYRRYYY